MKRVLVAAAFGVLLTQPAPAGPGMIVGGLSLPPSPAALHPTSFISNSSGSIISNSTTSALSQ